MFCDHIRQEHVQSATHKSTNTGKNETALLLFSLFKKPDNSAAINDPNSNECNRSSCKLAVMHSDDADGSESGWCIHNSHMSLYTLPALQTCSELSQRDAMFISLSYVFACKSCLCKLCIPSTYTTLQPEPYGGCLVTVDHSIANRLVVCMRAENMIYLTESWHVQLSNNVRLSR